MSNAETAHLELGVCQATPIEGSSFALDFSVVLRAPLARVYTAITAEIGRWWPHTYSENPHSIVLEEQVGGRFMELFDAAGHGVLLGHVEVLDPPTTLRIRGSVGMPRAVNIVYTLSLAEHADGTLLRERCSVSGEVSDRLREGMKGGTEEEYDVHLRAWVERGEALR